MTLKALITHQTGTKADTDLIAFAASLAASESAHLDVLCHGVDHMTAGFHYGTVDPMMVQQSLQAAMEEAAELEASTRAALEKTTTRWGVETVISPHGSLGRNVAMRSRFADLVLAASPYGETATDDDATVLEAALLYAGVPALILPKSAKAQVRPGKIVIGWNESPEALNAVKAALPLLRTAMQVRVTVIDPPRHGPDRSDPGGPLSVFLARHGVKAEIDVIGKSLPRVSDVLMRHAADKGADLVVMGAYGKSRFREAILGGATRDMLEQSSVPVFMAH